MPSNDRSGRAAERPRSRRLIAVGIVTAVVVAAAVILAVTWSGRSKSAASPVGGSSVGSPSSGPSVGPAGKADPAPAVYAAAIRWIATAARGETPGRVYVHDSLCLKTAEAGGVCADTEPLPGDQQVAIATALAGYAPVEFVHSESGLRDANLEVVNRGVIVQVGPAQVSGSRAQVTVSAVCGGLCGQGTTAVLERTSSGWAVTGTTGQMWIS
jgi:hypothetical protein